MRSTELRPEHAVELAELLEFVHDWFTTNRDNDAFHASLHRFSFGLFDLDELRSDISRFAYLLGGHASLLDDDQ